MFVYWEAAMSVGVTRAVLLNVSPFWKGRKELIVRNKIRKVSSSDTFGNILEDVYKDIITQDLRKHLFPLLLEKVRGQKMKRMKQFFWLMIFLKLRLFPTKFI